MTIDIGNAVQAYLPDDMEPELKAQVGTAMAGLGPMAILQLIADAQLVRDYVAKGENEKARAILMTHRAKAEAAGPEILAAFDAMFESL